MPPFHGYPTREPIVGSDPNGSGLEGVEGPGFEGVEGLGLYIRGFGRFKGWGAFGFRVDLGTGVAQVSGLGAWGLATLNPKPWILDPKP